MTEHASDQAGHKYFDFRNATMNTDCRKERIKCSMGVMAYNEEANIGALLDAVESQRTAIAAIEEIIVVTSGCTDGTEAIVRERSAQEPRIRLYAQTQREGKASAVNHFLAQAREQVLLLCSADVLPAPDAVEQLVAPFADPEVAMTGSRPVPVDDPDSFMGFAAHMLWNLHHEINQVEFKAGELIAFRKIFQRIPFHTAVDEASVESVIRGQGYQVRYVDTAITYNKGPDTVRDFLRQRRRIYAGHLALRDTVGYRVATLKGTAILKMVLRNLRWRPRDLMWTSAVAALEVCGRYLGRRDYHSRHDHSVWEIAKTTKQLQTPSSARKAAQGFAPVP